MRAFKFFLSGCFFVLSFFLVTTVNGQHNGFVIKRGTNIAHWLSQSKKRGEERNKFFTEADLSFIKKAGFDFIRIPVDEEQLWDSLGTKNDTAFGLLDNAITLASKLNLKVILDLHIIRSHYFLAEDKPLFTDPAEQDKFIVLWKDLSTICRKWPLDFLAYEPLNEPVAQKDEQWNVILKRAIDSIRSWEKERTIIIGSNRWQSVNTFANVYVPANDPNLILSFHFYEPFFLTHFRASFTKLKDFKGEVQYPGQIVVEPKAPEEKAVFNRDTLEKMMSKAIVVAKKYNLPLNCGEFGVIDGAPEAPKLAWYRDLMAIFDKHHISYANWNYKAGSFGIVDINIQPRKELVEILTGKGK